ncbi:hypothetical protein [Kitasatospora cineracea]|uniref:Uncharacterized protein n=1 Tax=Kitasatospora cineracea TaxID=88074 RepID=A0A8G1XB77_9ACTN|nr:hypothetical protein [Kitasatospora cineracea]ROR43399.1 hypothetical protein EDD39_1553 [Kitasatospora cineracea]
MSDLIVHIDPATGLPGGTVAVFLTLGAALVSLYESGGSTEYGRPTFLWHCLGCGDRSHYADQRGTVRGRANAHDGECRAITLPAPIREGVAR